MSIADTSPADLLRKRTWKRAYDAYGTAWVFEGRSRRLRDRLNFVNYAGIATPLLVGATVLSFGVKTDILPMMLTIVGIVGILQLLISLWSIIAKWVEGHAYSVESMLANNRLAARFEDLASNPPDDYDKFKERYDRIVVEDDHRRDLDMKWNVTEREKRSGTRYTLRRFKLRCEGCGKVPTSMVASKCDVCGNF